MQYRFFEWPDGATCARCAAEIHSGWDIDGKVYGPSCGKRVLRSLGVSWPDAYGPGAFDPEVLAHAMRMMAWDHKRRVWVHSWEERKAAKALVGSLGWNIAASVLRGHAMRVPGNSEALANFERCWKAAQQALRLLRG